VPVAATLKEAVWPAVTVWLPGCVVIEGARKRTYGKDSTLLVTLPAVLLTTTVNCAVVRARRAGWCSWRK